MAKLVVSYNGIVEGHYFLDKTRFTIGRIPDNDIFLNDPGVSNVHAVIVTMSNDHVLEDVASTNGVLVNEKKIAKHILQNNDVIELCGYQLKYVNQRALADRDFDKTMISTQALWDPNGGPDAATLPVKPLLATAVLTARAVKTNFPLGGVIYLEGGSPDKKILIDAPLKTFGQPGKQVLMISRRPHGYYVTHVEGKNPPKVNGKSVGTRAWPLEENDVIETGEVKLKFFMPHEKQEP
jgi:hypothetical protein